MFNNNVCVNLSPKVEIIKKLETPYAFLVKTATLVFPAHPSGSFTFRSTFYISTYQ